MKKTNLILLSILLISAIAGYSQISEGGLPPSFKSKSTSKYKLKEIPKIDITKLQALNVENAKNGTCIISAEYTQININLIKSGTWSDLPNGDKICRLKLKSEGAKALSVCYNDFYLPKGSKLFLYNEDKSQILGAYTYKNNTTNRIFSNELVQGETVTLEYYTPLGVHNSSDKPSIIISELGYIFRDVERLFPNKSKGTGWELSAPCHINVNCSPEGDNWQIQKKGVAEIWVKIGISGGWCTGTLINNTSQNGTTYFITANHCGKSASAQDFGQWQFYFHYESPGCINPSAEPSYQALNGAEKIANGDASGGSDFLLLQLIISPPDYYNIYYNGWDRSGEPSQNGVCIHHPSGDIQKISTYTQELTSATPFFEPNITMATNSTWEVYWAETQNGKSAVEGGSSGGPLFNSEGLQIGTVAGGLGTCQFPDSSEFFGKFAYHWETNGPTNDVQAKPWLDPLNTGVLECPGYDPNSTVMNSFFSSDKKTIFSGDSIKFYDLTNGSTVIDRKWHFTGGSIDSSEIINPTVKFDSTGTYTVTMVVSDGVDTDTLIRENYIKVLKNVIEVNFKANTTVINIGDTVRFSDLSTGIVTERSWTFEGGTPINSTEKNPKIVYNTAGAYSVSLYSTDQDISDSLTKVDYITVIDPNVGISKLENHKISIYPNPATNKVIVDSKNISITEIKIYNIFGGLIENLNQQNISNNKVSIDLYNVNSGIYFININTENSKIIKKISIIK